MPKLVWNNFKLIIDVYKSSYLVTVVLGASIERFSRSKRKGPLQYTVDNEVYALARLAFYKNLLIGQEISVSCLH